jgi:hypothetical protein
MKLPGRYPPPPDSISRHKLRIISYLGQQEGAKLGNYTVDESRLKAEYRRKQRGTFVHLAYLDDSDTKCKTNKWQVMSAVIIEDKTFKLAEMGMSNIPELLMGSEVQEKFQEFHACELYGGYGVFQGISQEVRLDAIGRLLALLKLMDISIVFGAVNIESLQSEVYASADPIDMCFRSCMDGVKHWADKSTTDRTQALLGHDIENYTIERMTPVVYDSVMEALVILIVDECDPKVKAMLQKTYRNIRPRRLHDPMAPLDCFHDDMYFGDSRYSMGIQLADLCSYFIARHLAGDEAIEGFYQMIEPQIAFSRVHPTKTEIAQTVTEEKE